MRDCQRRKLKSARAEGAGQPRLCVEAGLVQQVRVGLVREHALCRAAHHIVVADLANAGLGEQIRAAQARRRRRAQAEGAADKAAGGEQRCKAASGRNSDGAFVVERKVRRSVDHATSIYERKMSVNRRSSYPWTCRHHCPAEVPVHRRGLHGHGGRFLRAARARRWRGLRHGGGTRAHNYLGSAFVRRLGHALDAAGCGCFAFGSDMRVATDEATHVYPDAVVVCPPIEAPSEDACSVSNPVIVVEVVSPSSATRDVLGKRERYARFPSLQHDLVAQTAAWRIEHFRRMSDGSWRVSTHGPEDTLHLDALGARTGLPRWRATDRRPARDGRV